MEVLIKGKHHTHTDNPVIAYDIYGNPHTIKPVDWNLYNFTSFQKLIIDGVEISRESEEGMEINDLLKIAKKGNLTDCGQRKCADTIEAQQQEIDQLKAQAGRVMRMEEGLKGQRSFLQLLNNLGGLGYEKHGWISDHIKAIDALLGGKEDV